MTSNDHLSAPTRFVEANGVHYAFRRFGAASGTPLLFLQHLRGGMDHWDPAVTDGLAAGRPVILFDNAGVASSSGQTPETMEGFADHAAAFVGALGLTHVDVLGFSIGGHAAQALALRHPRLVRRLVIVGSRPRAGVDEGIHPDVLEVASRHEVMTLEDFLFLFFEPTPSSEAAGREFWQRRHCRTADVDPPTSQATMKAQIAALLEWRELRGERYAELKSITQPTLVVNGIHDIMCPTINSYVLAEHIPNAELIIYPDAGHGALFQYAPLFVSQVAQFLDSAVPFQARHAPYIDDANLPNPTDGFVVTMFITVRSIARSRDFYSRVLGGTVLMEENPCIVKLANSWILMNPGGPPTPDKPGITVANYEPDETTSIFLNLRVADIQACYEEWKSKGAEFLTPPIDREAEIRCYMRDPDGYLIEVGQATGILHGVHARRRPEDLPG